MAKAAPSFEEQLYNKLHQRYSVIQKKAGLAGGAEERGKPLHTGMLMSDLTLGGSGIVAGGWYSFVGPEGSGKSTEAQTIMVNGAAAGIPHNHFWDYEGCTTKDTTYRIDGKDVLLSALIPKDYTPEAIGWTGIELKIDSIGKQQVVAELYYGGINEITRITTESGKELKGFKHPVMVQVPDGRLAWKMLEDLEVGDVLIRDEAAP